MRNLGDLFYAALLIVGIFLVYSAYAGEYVEGKQYQRLPVAVSDNALVKDLLKEGNGKVQVLEFFSYGCSWCFKLDPYVEKWLKTAPANVEFQRVPVEFHPTWGTLTKAYYTQVDLKALNKIHTALFDAVHTERISSTSEDALRQFFATHGITEQDFTKTFNSFDVTRKQKWANTIAQTYRITAVPAVIVQGPKGVFITAVKFAGSEEELIKVVDDLVKMQSEGVKATPTADAKNVAPKLVNSKQ